MTRRKRLPIIFVPGMGGSQLEAKLIEEDRNETFFKTDRWKLLWLHTELLLSHRYILERCKITFDETNFKFANKDQNLLIRPVKFGKVDGIKYINAPIKFLTFIFYYIIGMLTNHLGYTKNENLKGAPYDFRIIPNYTDVKKYFQDLDQLIMKTFDNCGLPVIIISHSMGSTLMHTYITTRLQTWKHKYIDSWISLSGPFGGSIEALRAVLFGRKYPVPSLFASSKHYHAVQKKLPSMYYMLPSKLVYGEDTPIIKSEKRNFTTNNFDEIFEKFEIKYAKSIINTTLSLKTPCFIGIQTLFIYSYGITTPKTIIIDEENSFVNYEYGDGDGTVELSSLEYCRLFKSFEPNNVRIIKFENLEHQEILYDEMCIREIEKFIMNRNNLYRKHFI